MSTLIGVLLPRSTDYPSIGFDILDGLRSYFKQAGKTDIRFISENIGFGDDSALNYSKAEKLILQDDVDVIVVYSNPHNAEPLYTLANTTQKLFIILDAGVQHPYPETLQSPFVFHISLQGMEANYLSGKRAGEGGRKVLKATSFYEGGYRSPWAAVQGIEAMNGTICGNYVSAYRISDFNLDQYMHLLSTTQPDAVAASFSMYLGGLFMSSLKQAGSQAISVPFYCSSFMLEEQQLSQWDFPGGHFTGFVPWATAISNPEQEKFMETIKKEKNKTATIFHLMGWEAGIVAEYVLENKDALPGLLKGWTYESPRGKQTFHPGTHYSYGPLYTASIVEGENGKCAFSLGEQIPADQDRQASILTNIPENSSDWKNNYLCI